MIRNSMGQFMAALRKANGMTQQEVADRLNVSNKAVSRWERDECAPDIMLIPAIAEMYGVTCDELLRGERMAQSTAVQQPGEEGAEQNASEKGKPDKRAERQRKAVIGRVLSGFKTKTLISIALSVVGLICMFGISYGFYRPVVGLAVLLLFVAAAVVLEIIAVNKLKELKDNELFEDADEKDRKRVDDCHGNNSFAGFFTALSAVAVSFPLVLVRSEYYIESVLEFQSYLVYFVGVALILIIVCLLIKAPYLRWITGNKKDVVEWNKNYILLNIIQFTAWALALVIAIILPYFDEFDPETETIVSGFGAGPLVLFVLMACLPVAWLVFLIKEKKEKPRILVAGLRNVLLIPTIFLISNAHIVGFGYNYMLSESYRKFEHWNQMQIFKGIGWALLVMAVFVFLEKLLVRKKA